MNCIDRSKDGEQHHATEEVLRAKRDTLDKQIQVQHDYLENMNKHNVDAAIACIRNSIEKKYGGHKNLNVVNRNIYLCAINAILFFEDDNNE